MKHFIWCCCVLALIPVYILAQKNDSLRLLCPLKEATILPPAKGLIHFDETDYCIALASTTDTAVKAITNGRVTNVIQSEEDSGKWEIVLFTKFQSKEYYFWYSGITKVTVRRNDKLKEGESVGFIKPGEKIELLMYDFETPIDPVKYLDCKCAKGLSGSK